MSTESLGRMLTSCQRMLEGGAKPVSNQKYYQSVVHTTVRVLDSLLYLTSTHTHSHMQTHIAHVAYPVISTCI